MLTIGGKMKLYTKKHHRYVERQIHFGVGQNTKTVCGLVLFSRRVMVSVYSDSDGAVIVDDLARVTCKRCLATRDMRLKKLIATEKAIPRIFDHEALCGEAWLLDHALDISQREIDAQKLEVSDGEKNITLSNVIKTKDRKYILRNLQLGQLSRE